MWKIFLQNRPKRYKFKSDIWKTVMARCEMLYIMSPIFLIIFLNIKSQILIFKIILSFYKFSTSQQDFCKYLRALTRVLLTPKNLIKYRFEKVLH